MEWRCFALHLLRVKKWLISLEVELEYLFDAKDRSGIDWPVFYRRMYGYEKLLVAGSCTHPGECHL
ncbi:hypothetical protein RGCCGE502_28853 (plasmid) [Rhizobium grahamii CCGE 502]|uniref:Uncharacterized protein n=1 Tax=Rhizobium grahamii CCGE 502 TaxID=990285 RepID=S3H6T1_9HYPH|nr:hypothetical protein RGCCGE502_28853 [Rhizobium grahamii CCGE 502]